MTGTHGPNSRLILYGNSVFLAGIKAQLAHDPAFEVITVEGVRTDMVDWIRACQPQAVLFDLAIGYLDFAVALLHEQPSLLLIGVDPSSNELLVLSSQQERAVAMEDLLRVISRDDTKKGRYRDEEIKTREGLFIDKTSKSEATLMIPNKRKDG